MADAAHEVGHIFRLVTACRRCRRLTDERGLDLTRQEVE